MGPNYLFIQLSALLSRSRSGRSASRFRKRGQVGTASSRRGGAEAVKAAALTLFSFALRSSSRLPRRTDGRTERCCVIVSGPTGARSRVAGVAAATGVFEIKGRGSSRPGLIG